MSSNLSKATLVSILSMSAVAPLSHAVEIFSHDDGEHVTKINLGGYVKVDLRHVDGDVAYQDYWVGNFPGDTATETSHTGFNVRESRINMNLSRDDVSGFFEIDFYGGGGNEVISNSSNVRVRHAFIKYQDWLAGQTWSTFMPLNVIPETLDFGGPHVGEVFIRAVQLRYTYGNWQFAIENPETWGDGDVGTPSSALGLTGDQADADESIPDFVARYNYQNDWGSFALAGLLRKVDQGGLDKTSGAINISGKIDSVGKDDFRFQVTFGEPGRYVSAALTTDIVTNPDNQLTEVEQTLAYTLAYRHYWNDTLRTTAFYGAAKTEVAEKKRAHWGINLIESLTDSLNVGVEVGNYRVADPDITSVSSNYLQFSAQYSF